MRIGLDNALQRVEDRLQAFNPVKDVKEIAQSAAVDLATRTQDLLSTGAAAIPGLDRLAPSLPSRASFPSNPLSLSNLKYLGRLLLGTIPLTNRLSLDLVEDGKIETYPKNGGLKSDTKVYLVNGVATNDGARATMGEQTARGLGRNVTFVNNSTTGVGFDLLQCVQELVFAKSTKPTETLANEIVKNLTSATPQKMELIGYSQGSIITTHALSLAITRMKADGYSDAEIKQLMSDNVRVALAGCPVDLNNPAHTIANVPPGMPGPETKRLDYYFTVEDRLLTGKGDRPFGEEIKRETGSGELARPNFEIIRHDKDLVATTLHDIKLSDLSDIVKDPVGLAGRLGAQVLEDVGVSIKDTINPVGYHMYDSIYLDYMINKGLIE